MTAKPIPVPDEITAGFWDAARGRRLVIQRCADCAGYQHPPFPVCQACGSESLAYAPVSGRGTVRSFTISRDNPVPGFDGGTMILVDVELVERPGLRMQTNVLDAAPGDLRIGAPVEVAWEELDEGAVLPQFRMVPGE